MFQDPDVTVDVYPQTDPLCKEPALLTELNPGTPEELVDLLESLGKPVTVTISGVVNWTPEGDA